MAVEERAQRKWGEAAWKSYYSPFGSRKLNPLRLEVIRRAHWCRKGGVPQVEMRRSASPAPPSSYQNHRMRILRARLRWMHLLPFPALVPGFTMLWLHKRLGIGNDFLMGTDRRSADFNLGMTCVLQLGLMTFLGLTIYAHYKAPSRWWLVVKVVALAGYLTSIYVVANS